MNWTHSKWLVLDQKDGPKSFWSHWVPDSNWFLFWGWDQNENPFWDYPTFKKSKHSTGGPPLMQKSLTQSPTYTVLAYISANGEFHISWVFRTVPITRISRNAFFSRPKIRVRPSVWLYTSICFENRWSSKISTRNFSNKMHICAANDQQ